MVLVDMEYHEIYRLAYAKGTCRKLEVKARLVGVLR